jgi:uncharacterized protein YdeI (YjbR/CyaY-like superfamily)
MMSLPKSEANESVSKYDTIERSQKWPKPFDIIYERRQIINVNYFCEISGSHSCEYEAPCSLVVVVGSFTCGYSFHNQGDE